MQKCPYCGRTFKNKQAVRAHLKYCPLKPGEGKIITKRFEIGNVRFEIKLKEQYWKAVQLTYKRARERNLDVIQTMVGAVYALYYAGIIKKYRIEPKQNSNSPS